MIENLLALAPDLEITLLGRQGHGALQGGLSSLPVVRVPEVPVPRLREALSYMRFNLTAGRRFDIMHYPRAIVYPFFWRVARRCVVTVHDAGYLMLHHLKDDVGPLAPKPQLTKRLYNWTLRAYSRKVDAAIAVSAWSRGEVARRYGIPMERIHVVYNAPDEAFRPLPDRRDLQADLARRYGIPESFVLAVGRLQPHKNARGLLRAWAALGEDLRSRHRLVVLGRRYWRFDDVFTLARNLGIAGEVVFLDQVVSDEDLARFYNAAEVFVFPSLYEGFGLPLVEALACGAPTVASNAASMPEVAGDAALLADPRDPQAMAAAIRRLLSDDGLRAELSRRAVAQARKFTWRQSAQQVLGLYRALASSGSTAPVGQPSSVGG
jgi:glycosyltransferase involved in cell wall biosynthesis